MDYAGSNVTLSISSTCLTLKSRDTHAIISTHDMPRISFASGGDAVWIMILCLHKIYTFK
jgi:SHC-transforming protein 1